MQLCKHKQKMRLALLALLWCCRAGLAQVPSTPPAVREVLDKAMGAAKSAVDGNVKKETFPMLAELWVKADPKEAASRIRELVDASGGFVDGLKRAAVLVKLARFQGLAGDRAHALATLDRAERDANGALFVVTSHAWTYFWSEMPGPEILATRTNAAGDIVEEIERVREEVGGPSARTRRAAPTVGNSNASVPPLDPQSADALREIARIQSGNGSWSDVLRTVTLVKSPLKRVDLLCRTAEAAAKVRDAGLQATAYEAARDGCSKMNIFTPKERASAFARLAASLTSTGNVAQARKVTPNLWDPRERGRVKRLIAYVETTRGGGAGTLKWVESEWVADARVYGLIGIAEAMLGRGYPPDPVE